MNYQTIEPPDFLKPFVSHFWSLESTADDASQKSFRTLANGCPGLIFQPGEQGTFYQNGKLLPDVFLFGQTTRHAEIKVSGRFSTAGVYFHPHAIRSVFGFNAEELTDSCVDADLLAGTPNFRLSEQLGNGSSTAAQINTFASFLASQLNKKNVQGANNSRMRYALTQITQSKGIVSLLHLQQELAVSERTFERQFKQYVGISPKLFSRICRFQSSLKQLKNSKFEKLSDIAFEHDYADQSHFIRSFREFSGMSPYQYHKQSNAVTEDLSEVIQ